MDFSRVGPIKHEHPFLPPGPLRDVYSSSAMDDLSDVFSGRSAYEVLGVSETSSFAEIKASFRKLAKETHPDVNSGSEPAVGSRRFLQVLAAYEILSDAEKRAEYDGFLSSRRQILENSAAYTFRYKSYLQEPRQREVVEWLEWYRYAVQDIISERKVASREGYLGELENDLYSAIRAAYYGPDIESSAYLPDCFEAEERSIEQTPEVLHLVSGRDLLGIVYISDDSPQLTPGNVKKLNHNFPQFGEIKDTRIMPASPDGRASCSDRVPDAYRDLEVHICGQLIATATRDPPGCSEDCISVRHGSHRESSFRERKYSHLIGTIRGLGTTSEEGSCYAYDKNGERTHVIMIHRTLLVKHMHWYSIGDKIATCECRCSRARLPPSRFWLFEPRSSMHDIGGWYVETFGRDRKGMTIPSQREWHGSIDHHDKRLHPAMYFAALAYKTLDLELAQRQKKPIKDIIGSSVSSLVHWCKRLL